MKARRIITVALVVAFAREAQGDPACPDPGCHIKSPSTLTTARGSVLELPPGYFLDEPTWTRRDEELKLAQALNTRLKAENDALRKSASSDVSWVTAAIGAIGTVASVVLVAYLK